MTMETLLETKFDLEDFASSAEKEFLGEDNTFSQPKPTLQTNVVGDFSVIIILQKNSEFKNIIKPFDIEILGKKMWQWVESACDGYPVRTIAGGENANIISLIKPHLTSSKFTAVFFSDTPLLQKSTVNDIFTYAVSRDISVLNLSRGYVFNTEYIKSVDNVSLTTIQYFEEEDFIYAYNLKQLSIISDVLHVRINDFHLNNGVQIVDPSSTFIDADAIIESGVKIMPNNSIKGISYIGKNAYIGEGNIIENSIISDNAKVTMSCIKESRVSENTTVGPFEILEKRSV